MEINKYQKKALLRVIVMLSVALIISLIYTQMNTINLLKWPVFSLFSTTIVKVIVLFTCAYFAFMLTRVKKVGTAVMIALLGPLTVGIYPLIYASIILATKKIKVKENVDHEKAINKVRTASWISSVVLLVFLVISMVGIGATYANSTFDSWSDLTNYEFGSGNNNRDITVTPEEEQAQEDVEQAIEQYSDQDLAGSSEPFFRGIVRSLAPKDILAIVSSYTVISSFIALSYFVAPLFAITRVEKRGTKKSLWAIVFAPFTLNLWPFFTSIKPNKK